MKLFKTHDHTCNHQYVTVFVPYKKDDQKFKLQKVNSETWMTNHDNSDISSSTEFPPPHFLSHNLEKLLVISVVQLHQINLKRQVVVCVEN